MTNSNGQAPQEMIRLGMADVFGNETEDAILSSCNAAIRNAAQVKGYESAVRNIPEPIPAAKPVAAIKRQKVKRPPKPDLMP